MSAETPITETEIASIVERFYAKVRIDPEIGPVFNNAVQNWDAHLALLKDFWSTVLLTTGRYKGNPMMKHLLLMPRIGSEHFERWLSIWKRTTVELFPPATAEVFVRKAESMAERLLETIDRYQASLDQAPLDHAFATNQS